MDINNAVVICLQISIFELLNTTAANAGNCGAAL